MKIVQFSKYIKEHEEFAPNLPILEELKTRRNKMLEFFPYSVMVEGDFDEYEKAAKWCNEKTLLQTHRFEKIDAWQALYYGKESYDYAVWDFLFTEKDIADKFEEMIPELYITLPNGKKSRTNGWEESVSVD